MLHLFFSTAFTRVANAVTIIMLAGHIGAEEYGMFSLCVAYALIAGYFTDMGVKNIVMREASIEGANVSSIMSSYIKIRIYLLLLTLVVSGLIFIFFYDSIKLTKVLFLLVFPTVTGLTMQSIAITFFQLKEEMKFISNIRVISAITCTIGVLFGMWQGWGVDLISFFYGLSYIVAGVFGLYLLGRNIKFDFKYKLEKRMFKGLLSFIISGLLIMVIPQIGILTIEKVLTLKEVGFYSVAYRIPTALYQIPGVVAGAFYPVLFKHYNSNNYIAHRETNVKQVKIMSILGMLASLPLLFYPDWIIKTLFGAQWLPASLLLQVLSLVVVLQSINFPLGDGLTTKGQQKFRTIVLSIAVVSGILYYYMLSLEFNSLGAACAAVLVEITMFIGFIAVNKDRRWIIKQALLINFLLYLLVIILGGMVWHNLNFYLGTTLNCLLLIGLFILVDKEVRGYVVQFKMSKQLDRSK
ncbi:oligosaccharide flippase family protein [Priestia flexa]|uniref:oligosaccharide flippase family protein n=1 Tax=Priestia flexa TaxID=86664 RepID=UPI00203B580C|nr:oligosaccharide flippase family protein [Priestia flexa]MCM3068378.1 oligosaccharide flippase family protein [Priestia flexa]